VATPDTETFLRGLLARPKEWAVVTAYAGGATRTHETASHGAAENYAVGERRKIGRDLIDRGTGSIVRVTAVTIQRKDAQ
jgi:hypothetical protein